MFKNLLLIFFAILLAVSAFFNLHFLNEKKENMRVLEVVDGDTFQLKSGKRVRLMGVDAPEYSRCGGQEAKEFLKNLVSNKIVSLQEETQEAYGRALSLVYANNLLINEEVLKAGWGRTDYRKNSKRQILTNAFHAAQQKKIGIWSELCRAEGNFAKPESPDCLIKGNIDKGTYKKFYHFPGCRQYNMVAMEKDVGDRWFCSEVEATSAGFVRASGCP
jgi:endonuclease YncB( thermonuclease family)